MKMRSWRNIVVLWTWPCVECAVGQGLPPTAVHVDAVTLEQVQERRLVTGELKAARRARVATEEAGLVMEVRVTEGQTVKQGDVLAQLDRKRLEIELQQVEAEEQVAAAGLEERRAEMHWHELDLENYRDLTKGGASNRKELYDAESQVRIARAKLAAAESLIDSIRARAALLNKRIADTTIRAPVDGAVVAKNTEVGQRLDTGDVALELVATGAIDAWLDVPQQLIGAVVGKSPLITVNIDATAESIDTSDTRAVRQVDRKSRSFAVVARLENPRGWLAPGMSVTAWVPTGDKTAQLTIHKNAILRNDVGAFVYVARGTGSGSQGPNSPSNANGGSAIAMPVQVLPLFAINDRFVVKAANLAAGDLLIVEGNERLFPMAPVMPVPAN
jgi:RND family efflux transporter MFP subunit